MCANLHGIAHSFVSIIIRSCEAIKNHMRPLVFEKPTLLWLLLVCVICMWGGGWFVARGSFIC